MEVVVEDNRRIADAEPGEGGLDPQPVSSNTQQRESDGEMFIAMLPPNYLCSWKDFLADG